MDTVFVFHELTGLGFRMTHLHIVPSLRIIRSRADSHAFSKCPRGAGKEIITFYVRTSVIN
jgi:hypothetical protein